MRTNVFILMLCFLVSTGCSENSGLEIMGSARYHVLSRNNYEFGESKAIEASTILVEDKIYSFLDKNYSGSFDLKILEGETWADSHTTGIDYARFPYTFFKDGFYYTIGMTKSANLMLWSSPTGQNWTLRNGGAPILDQSTNPKSIWYNVWNVAIMVDSSGIAHIFSECSDSTPGQAHVGIAYSSAVWNPDSISFNQNKSDVHVIKNAGNPYVSNGLLIYGAVNRGDADFGDYWFVTLATSNQGSDLSQPSSWTERQDLMKIGARDMHVADPHIVNMPTSGSMLSVSFDQSYSVGILLDVEIEGLF